MASHTQLAVLLDLDGTLVDSSYLHVLAWDAAFAAAGYEVAHWRIHGSLGMGGDRLVPRLLGRHVPEAGDISDDHTRRFLDAADRLRATDGALALIDDLERRGVPFALATSATGAEGEALLAALGRDDLPAAGADSVGAPKPAPDVLLAACEQLDIPSERAVLIGDSPWDADAAARVGAGMVGVRCGGFGDDRLRGFGASDIVDAPRDLIGRL
ncbi:MAG: HAD family hydrolase [Actinobacteria bacterium]|nr:HAD family hydrolase [Actinomycetota bacterium]